MRIALSIESYATLNLSGWLLIDDPVKGSGYCLMNTQQTINCGYAMIERATRCSFSGSARTGDSAQELHPVVAHNDRGLKRKNGFPEQRKLEPYNTLLAITGTKLRQQVSTTAYG